MSKFERKFKNGDNVIVKSTGKTGTISGYSDKKYSVLISGRVYKYSTKNLEKTSEKVSEKFQVGDKVKINSSYDHKRHNKIGTIIKHHHINWWTVQIPGYKGHDGNGNWGVPGNNDKYHVREDELTKVVEDKFQIGDKVKINSSYAPDRHNKIGTIVKKFEDRWIVKIPNFIGHDENGNYHIPGNNDKGTILESELTKVLEDSLKIGDRVKIDWTFDMSDGKIGTIVGEYDDTRWTVKIPGFEGHEGCIDDDTSDKWYVSESNLTKIPEETVTKSMKIEVKSTPKTSETVSYPCFKKGLDHDSVVLFFNETSGITVEGNVGSFRETRNPKKYGKPLENYSVTFSSIP